MVAQLVTLQGRLDENGRLIVYIPPEIAVESVEVQAQPALPDIPLTREAARARLKAAGMLSEVKYAPPDAQPVSKSEFERLTRLFAGERPASDLVDEDRGLH